MDGIITGATVVVIAVCGSLVLIWSAWAFVARPYLLAQRYRAQGVPGSAFTPLLGDLRIFRRIRAACAQAACSSGASSGQEAFDYLTETYGAGRPHFYFFGPELRLRLVDLEQIKAVIVTQADAFRKPARVAQLLVPILGDGLVTSEGSKHKRHRLMLTPAFQFSKLQGMTCLIARAAARAASSLLESASSSSTLEMNHEISELTLAIISEAAFGLNINQNEPASAALTRYLASSLGSLGAFSIAVVMFPALRFLDFLAQARRWSVHRLLRQVIADRRRTRALRKEAAEAAAAGPRLAPGQLGVDASVLSSPIISQHPAGDSPTDTAPPPAAEGAGACSELLLDYLIDATSSNEPGNNSGATQLTDAEVMAEALTFMVAGHETTSQALTWTMLLLARHPEWRDRARAQVDAVLGVGPTARLPTHDDLGAMPLLLAVLQEAMRLFPPVPAVLREATRDVELPGGLTVPATGGVVITIATVHRNPALWERPDEFDPGRFEHGLAAALKHPLAWMPFVAGPRNCIGAQFALLEARVILAVFLQRLDWAVAPEYRHHPILAITLKPAFGLPMVVTSRAGAA